MASVEEKTQALQVVHRGRLLTMEVLDVELPDGRRACREVVRHRGAVGVLARLPGADFVLVRQFRKAVESEVTEIVAGCIENGEKPEACARREVKEETGYDVVSLRVLGRIWASPGYSSEELHLFFAELAPEAGVKTPDSDEDLSIVRIAEAELDRMVSGNEIVDSKTIAAWCLWKSARR